MYKVDFMFIFFYVYILNTYLTLERRLCNLIKLSIIIVIFIKLKHYIRSCHVIMCDTYA